MTTLPGAGFPAPGFKEEDFLRKERSRRLFRRAIWKKLQQQMLIPTKMN